MTPTEKQPAEMSDTPRTDEILSLIPGGNSCDPQIVADELRPEITNLERELAEKDQKIAALQSQLNIALDALDRGRK